MEFLFLIRYSFHEAGLLRVTDYGAEMVWIIYW